MRERGLKQEPYYTIEISMKSFPVRERGLKLAYPPNRIILNGVVPRAGTWIETDQSGAEIAYCSLVVPRAGTWIETVNLSDNPISLIVVPRAGTWIETMYNDTILILLSSFPVRERGLKHKYV